EVLDRDPHPRPRAGHCLLDVAAQAIDRIGGAERRLDRDDGQRDDGDETQHPSLDIARDHRNLLLTAAPTSDRGTDTCSPLRMSLMATSPRARSSSPTMATNGTLRLEAYLNCFPSLSASG